MFSEIKETHEMAKSEAANKALTEEQSKMVAEIQKLKSTVEELENEKNCMKMVLDIK
jgi:cell division protein FtsB